MENKLKLKGYRLNPNYTPSAGDHFWVADWNNDEIKELVSMTPTGWWYNRECKLERGFAGEDFLLFGSGTFGTATEDNIPWGARRIFKSDILAPIYNPESVVVTCNGIKLTASKVPPPKKEKPELKYTELWMADCGSRCIGGELTSGKYYDIVSARGTSGRMIFEVVCDTGTLYSYNQGWFKPVRLYDEDESELICRDIEFAEGDYIDKHKWTSEQLVHLSKFYKFYRLSTACKKDLPFLVWDIDSEWLSGRDFECTGKEYTYDDIFYSEEN